MQRELAVCGAVAIVVGVAVVGLTSQPLVAAGGAMAATVNPVRPVAPDDVQVDPSHGFLVLVEQDATLASNETEGPLAVGGDLTFSGYQTGSNNPGTYLLAGDAAPTSLVVGGQVDFPGSAPGSQLNVLNSSYAKIGDLTQATVIADGGITTVVALGGDASTRPAVSIHATQPALSVGGPSGFDLPALFATYRQLAADMAECGQTVTLGNANSDGPWNGTDPVATIGLEAGQNVLTLTPEQAATLEVINPRNGGRQPGDEAWLIVNVRVTGDYTWAMPEVSWQGNTPSRHVLWNLTTTGTVTLPPSSPTVWGTVYAPNATLIDESSANIEGNVVVAALTHGTSQDNGGEMHFAPFADLVTTCAPNTTTTGGTTSTSAAVTTTDLGYGEIGSGGGVLPSTGVTGMPLAIPALLLLTSGGLLLLAARRRGRQLGSRADR